MTSNILIGGRSATGKTASLLAMAKDKGIMYLNCDAGKEIPFKNSFTSLTITDPKLVPQAIKEAEGMKHIHTIVVDTITFMMAMYESMYVLTAGEKDKFSAWSDYAQFWKNMMQKEVATSTKNIVFMAHTAHELNEDENVAEVLIKVKGQLMNEGIESWFSNVVATKKLPLVKISPYKNKYLNITEDDEILGYKYVFQTRLTKETVNERIRGPVGMWSKQETYIDNNVSFLLERLNEYYS
jgi:hypothetical protein